MDARGRACAYTCGFLMTLADKSKVRDVCNEVLDFIAVSKNTVKVICIKEDKVSNVNNASMVQIGIRLKAQTVVTSHFKLVTAFRSLLLTDNDSIFWEDLVNGGQGNVISIQEFDKLTLSKNVPFMTAERATSISTSKSNGPNVNKQWDGYIFRINYHQRAKNTVQDKTGKLNAFEIAFPTSSAEWSKKLQDSLTDLGQSKRISITGLELHPNFQGRDCARDFLMFAEYDGYPTETTFQKVVLSINSHLTDNNMIPSGWKLGVEQGYNLYYVVDSRVDKVEWPLVDNIVIPHSATSGTFNYSSNKKLHKIMREAAAARACQLAIKANAENTAESHEQLTTFMSKLPGTDIDVTKEMDNMFQVMSLHTDKTRDLYEVQKVKEDANVKIEKLAQVSMAKVTELVKIMDEKDNKIKLLDANQEKVYEHNDELVAEVRALKKELTEAKRRLNMPSREAFDEILKATSIDDIM